ncbi:hypothetical protein GDO81_026917, partial [Engystomops pustulosus]
ATTTTQATSPPPPTEPPTTAPVPTLGTTPGTTTPGTTTPGTIKVIHPSSPADILGPTSSHRELQPPTTRNSSVFQQYGNGDSDLRSTLTAAVIGVAVPVAVLALLCLSGFLIWRNWKRKNTKSMNFDNPVYRKTTEEEEEEEEEIHIGRTSQIGHVYPAVSTTVPGHVQP